MKWLLLVALRKEPTESLLKQKGRPSAAFVVFLKQDDSTRTAYSAGGFPPEIDEARNRWLFASISPINLSLAPGAPLRSNFNHSGYAWETGPNGLKLEAPMLSVDFFNFAQRAFCAATILARPAGLSFPRLFPGAESLGFALPPWDCLCPP